MVSYIFALSLRGILRSYKTPVNFLQLDHAACTRRFRSLLMVPSVSITDPNYLKWSTLFSSSPFSLIGSGFSLVDRCSVFATLIFIPLSVKTFWTRQFEEEKPDQNQGIYCVLIFLVPMHRHCSSVLYFLCNIINQICLRNSQISNVDRFVSTSNNYSTRLPCQTC